MRTLLSSLLLAVLSLSLGTAARAASPFAGTYQVAFIETGADTSNRAAQYGTAKVSSTGAMTITVIYYVTGSGISGKVGKTEVHTGKVSSTGAVTINGIDAKISVKMVKSGTTVLGFTGTVTPNGPHTQSAYMLGLRKP